MEQSLAILGRQPALGLAELEALYGAAVRPAGPQAASIDRPAADVAFARLGGAIKLGRVVARVDGSAWPAVERQLRASALALARDAPAGKLKLGLSVYGLPLSVAKLGAAGLNLKKALRGSGRDGSVRIVPNKELELNSAQVLHNGLTGPHGIELLVVRDGTSTIIARTVAVQDIDAYTVRDQGRPKRDARVGMLPPKLAQTIVNLAAGYDRSPNAILDPFCGTGVVLQEALLMGYEVYGSDIEPRMVDFSRANIEWLSRQVRYDGNLLGLETADATVHNWQSATINAVACETYLGQPFSSPPAADKLAEVRSTCNTILRKFLRNIAGQLPASSRLCLAVPAWQQRPGQFLHLPVIDHLEDMGYNRVSFKHVGPENLIYARADQIVARELLVLTKL